VTDIDKLTSIAAHWLGIQHRTTAWRMAQAFVGGAFGIFGVSYLMHQWLGSSVNLPLLVAPIGASTVLLFGVPASPLAQPWAIVGGNTISALCGIFWLKVIPDPAYAAALAVASAIAMMSLARCLHPPGGACALTSVIGGHTVVAAGWSFAFMPVAADSALLVAFGLLYNTAIRGNYPHRAASYTAAVPAKAGYSIADIESVLAQYDELLDVSSEDLDTLFRQVETRAYRRLHGVIRCEQIMRSDMPAVNLVATLDQARPLFAASGLRALPVIDDDGHVEGLLSVSSLSQPGDSPVARVLERSPCIAPPQTPIDELLPILSGGIYHEALVVDAQGDLLGLITQTDLLCALWRGHIAEQIALSSDG
jgi:CBS domain-containing membrane protein